MRGMTSKNTIAGLMLAALCLTAGGAMAGTLTVSPNLWVANTNPTSTVTNRTIAANVATLTIGSNHGFAVGQRVTVAGVGADYNGDRAITAVAATTISFATAGANEAATASTGTVVRDLTLAATDITDITAVVANVATVTTTAAHGFSAGETVIIAGSATAAFNGTFVIVSAPTATTFTYAVTAAAGTTDAGGTATASIDQPNLVVEITTAGSFAGATGVTFGGVAGTNFFMIDNTKVIVQPPAMAIGRYTVAVTGTAHSDANAFSYTRANRTLQVSIKMTVAKDASISWDTGTSNSDTDIALLGGLPHPAGSIQPFDWYVSDAEYGTPAAGNPAQINLDSTYSTTAAPNAKSLLLRTASKTGSQIRIDAFATDTVPSSGVAADAWLVSAAAPGANTFRVTGAIAGGTGNQFLLRDTAANLRAAGAPAAGLVLSLQVETPATANTAGVTQTCTVSLVAVAP